MQRAVPNTQCSLADENFGMRAGFKFEFPSHNLQLVYVSTLKPQGVSGVFCMLNEKCIEHQRILLSSGQVDSEGGATERATLWK